MHNVKPLERTKKWIDDRTINSYYWTGIVMNNQSGMVFLAVEDRDKLNRLIEDFLKDPRTKYWSK